MSNNQINEDTMSDLLNRIDSLDALLGDIRLEVEDAAGSLESLRGYVRALGAEKKQGLFAGSKPKKTFTVGGVTEEGDVESLPIGSRIENVSAAYWQKTGEDEWTDEGDGRVWPSAAIRMLGRKILRVGYGEPLPLREAFDAWGANAIVELVKLPGFALTLSPDGAAHYAYGNGIEAAGFQDETVRLVAVLDDGKVIPGKAEEPKAAFFPGDVVFIYDGPFDGLKGNVLRVDLNLDNPYLVRAEGTTGFGRYGADDLFFSRRDNVLDTTPGDRIRNLWTGEVHTVTRASGLAAAHMFEFLMPKRVPKIGDVIDLRAARKLPVGSRVSVPGGGVYWEKSSGGKWFCASQWNPRPVQSACDGDVFSPVFNRRLLRYGNGDL